MTGMNMYPWIFWLLCVFLASIPKFLPTDTHSLPIAYKEQSELKVQQLKFLTLTLNF